MARSIPDSLEIPQADRALASSSGAGALRILVASHKLAPVPRDPAYLPVLAGSALGPPVPGFARDDSGENISAKNPSYCELTAMYWAWKNLEAGAVGLVHYRRYFRARGAIASQEDFAAALEKADAILPAKRNYFIESTYSQYAHAHHAKDLDAARSAIEKLHPRFLDAFDRTMRSTKGHRFNMFVMKRPLFDEYCEWLFGILSELEKTIDTSGYSAYDKRVFGFIAERLLDVWISAKRVRFAEMPVVHTEGENWPLKIWRFLRRKFGYSSSSSLSPA